MAGDTHNEITGIVIGPAILGRDITVVLPPKVGPSLLGLRAMEPEFVGRDEVLWELLTLMNPATYRAGSGVVRVSTVTGLGGVGKTELALQAAHRALAAGWFPGGALMVDLHGYEPKPRRLDPAQALNDLLEALSVPGDCIPAELQGRQRMFRAILARYAAEGRPILVVIDNASPQAPAEPLLPGAGVAVVTSRHKLTDLPGRLLDLQVLTNQATVELLGRLLAETLGPADLRVKNHPEDAAQVARLCAGLPLAVKLVSSQLAAHPSKPLKQMATNLRNEQERLEEMKFEPGTVPAVRAAFELSYRNLPADQAHLFRLLPISPGPDISTQTAAVLAGLDQTSARRSLDALTQAHLIEGGSTYGRWQMHDLVRLFADELGRAAAVADRRDQALTTVLEHYLTTTQAATEHLNLTDTEDEADEFSGHTQALAWLDAEYANLVAVVKTTTTDSAHQQIARDLPLALVDFLDRRRRLSDWITLTTDALHAARHLGDRYREGSALSNLGTALAETRRFAEALTNYQQAADIFREIGDRDGEGTALSNAGTVLVEMQRHHEAVTVHRRSLRIFRQIDDKHSEAFALTNLGETLTHLQQFNEAITANQQAADIFRQTDDRHGQGFALSNLAGALAQMGQFSEAITLYQQAADIFDEIDDRHNECQALERLGQALAGMGRFDEAVTIYQQTAEVFREIGSQHNAGQALARLGGVLTKMGRFDEAVTIYQQAAHDFREAGDRPNEVIALIHRDEARRALVRHPMKAALSRLRTGRRKSSGNTDPA